MKESASWPSFKPTDVKILRTKMGLSQQKFAKWFGFHVSSVNLWESGRRNPSKEASFMMYQVGLKIDEKPTDGIENVKSYLTEI